jgi:hypothetical protein
LDIVANAGLAARQHVLGVVIVFGSLLLFPITSSGAQQKPSGAQPAGSRPVVVHLNGRWLADAIAVNAAGGEEVVVLVSALARAVDGSSVPGTTTRSSRLRVDGNTLFATRLGGCSDCAVRVARAVVISSRVRDVHGAPALPLSELVAAFEGRLETDSARTLYSIHAGKCTWCILEPSK